MFNLDCNLDFYTLIAVVIVTNISLLKNSSHEIMLNRWLAPFSIGWIISGLMLFLPLVHKGSLGSILMVYFLLGTLIANTLVLFACSKLPNQWVNLKSPTIEKVGGLFLFLLGTGLYVSVKNAIKLLFQWIDAILAPHRRSVARLNPA